MSLSVAFILDFDSAIGESVFIQIFPFQQNIAVRRNRFRGMSGGCDADLEQAVALIVDDDRFARLDGEGHGVFERFRTDFSILRDLCFGDFGSGEIRGECGKPHTCPGIRLRAAPGGAVRTQLFCQSVGNGQRIGRSNYFPSWQQDSSCCHQQSLYQDRHH